MHQQKEMKGDLIIKLSRVLTFAVHSLNTVFTLLTFASAQKKPSVIYTLFLYKNQESQVEAQHSYYSSVFELRNVLKICSYFEKVILIERTNLG